MDFLELSVEKRESLGTSSNKKIRRAGRIPAVVYSAGEDALALSVGEHEFIRAAKGALSAQLFKFKCDDSVLDGTLAFVKELQSEPLKDKLLHIDFLSVKEGQSVSVKVPLKTVGESNAVREGRAILNQTAYEITVDCVPSAIPSSLEVEVGKLAEGDSILAGDIVLPEGILLKSSANQAVVSLLNTKKGRTAEGAPVDGVAAEAEAGEGETPEADS